MGKISQISNDLKDWITGTLQSGVKPEAIVGAMIKKGFDERFAYSTILRLVSNQPITTVHHGGPAFVYEPVEITNKGNIIHADDRDVKVLFKVEKPLIVHLENVLSAEECDELIDFSTNRLQPSRIFDPKTGEIKEVPGRTSKGTYYQVNQNEFIAKLEKRFSDITSHPVGNGEGLQVLNYKIGEEYKAHFDYFPPDQVDSNSGGQRIATLLIYLNDVEAGGETVFPKLGLSVVPKKGSAVYFHYGNSKGQVDRMSLHCSIPVQKGEKWVATKWIREEEI